MLGTYRPGLASSQPAREPFCPFLGGSGGLKLNRGKLRPSVESTVRYRPSVCICLLAIYKTLRLKATPRGPGNELRLLLLQPIMGLRYSSSAYVIRQPLSP